MSSRNLQSAHPRPVLDLRHWPTAKGIGTGRVNGGIAQRRNQDHDSTKSQTITLTRFHNHRWAPGSTHAHASYICSCFIEEGNHMPPFCNGTLETGIECIAGEEGEGCGLAVEAGMRSVVVYDGLEARGAAYWLGRTWSLSIN